MKTKKSINTENKRQTSATAPHHLSQQGTGTETAKPAGPGPEAKPDNRLPIDSEARKQNRTLPTQTVVQRLADIPTAAQCASVVGKWVWVQFAEQPAAEIRQQLAQLGFHWNRTRQAWQHPCGAFSLAARTHDPRDTYASKPAMEAFN